MKRTLTTLALLAALAALPVLAQQGPPAGRGPGSGAGTGTPAAVSKIDVTKPSTVIGDVVSLKGGPGLGMPTLTVKAGGKDEPYVLGAYRYLTAQKFAPVAGDAVRLTLYTCVDCPQGFVVAEVENLTQKTVLKLRNADGTPIFAGRMGGAGYGRGAGAGCCGGNGAQAGPMDGTGPNPSCPKKS